MLRTSTWLSSLGLACFALVACGGSDASDTTFGQTGSAGAGQGGSKAGSSGTSQAGTSQGGSSQGGTSQGGTSQGGTSQGGGGVAGSSGGSAGLGGKAGSAGLGGKAGAGGVGGKAGAGGVGGKAGAGGLGGKAGAGGVGGKAGAPAAGAAGTGGAPAGGAAGAGGDPAGGAAGAGGGPAGGAGGAAGAGSDKCPGEAVAIGSGSAVALDGSTLTATNDGRSENGQCGGTSSNDVVYEITPSASGRLVVDSTTTYSGSIYARSACGTESSQLACDGNGSTQSITVDVKAGVPVYLFVDGFGQTNQAGGFHLDLTLIECGDGVVQSGEECDDHNTTPGDGCGATCQFEQGGACELQNSEPSSRTQPRNAPSQCLTAAFLQPLGPQQGIGDNGADEDWFCIEVAEGQTVQAGTFQTAPDSCNLPGNRDTIVEIYKGTPASDPQNVSCNGSTALACDDNSGPDACSAASYTVPAGEGGTYCARVIDNGKNGSIQFYNAYLAIR